MGWLLHGEQGHEAARGLRAGSMGQKLPGQDCLLLQSLGTESTVNVTPCSGWGLQAGTGAEKDGPGIQSRAAGPTQSLVQSCLILCALFLNR